MLKGMKSLNIIILGGKSLGFGGRVIWVYVFILLFENCVILRKWYGV